jgi:hypothetical protein
MDDNQGNTPSKAESLAAGTVELAVGMLDANTENYLLIFTGKDGSFGSASSDKTWAMGALERMRIVMHEQEKREARDSGR